MRTTFLALAAFYCISNQLKADVVYDNLSNTNSAVSGFTFNAHNAYAQKFSSGAGGEIANIKLNLYATGSTPAWSGTFNIQIYTGVSTSSSGTLFLDYFQGTQADIGTSAGGPVTFTYNRGATNTALNAGTDYYLVVNRTGTNGANLDWGGGPNGTGGTGNVFQSTDGGATWTNASFAAGFGGQINTVPEPGTLILGGIAAFSGGAGFWWKRRKGKAATPQAA